jgi:hypothetical protein
MLNAAERDPRCAVRIRVFLIDAEVVVRAGMRLLINSWQNCEVVGEADASPQAISALEAAAPDLIIVSDREFSQNGESDSFGDFNKLVEAAGTAPLLLMTNSRNSRLGAQRHKARGEGHRLDVGCTARIAYRNRLYFFQETCGSADPRFGVSPLPAERNAEQSRTLKVHSRTGSARLPPWWEEAAPIVK